MSTSKIFRIGMGMGYLAEKTHAYITQVFPQLLIPAESQFSTPSQFKWIGVKYTIARISF